MAAGDLHSQRLQQRLDVRDPRFTAQLDSDDDDACGRLKYNPQEVHERKLGASQAIRDAVGGSRSNALRSPETLHDHVADPEPLGERASAPSCAMGRGFVEGGMQDPVVESVPVFGFATRTGRVAQSARQPVKKIAAPP